MANSEAERMLEDRKKRSPFLTIADGESAIGKIKEIKTINKAGFSGEVEEFLSVVLECDVPEVGIMDKAFDNASGRWLKEVCDKNIDVGMTIKITRAGEATKTKYTIEILEGGEEKEEAPLPEEPIV